MPAYENAAEVTAAAETAVHLAGGVIDPYTRELVDEMGRGEITGDQAVAALLERFVGVAPAR